MNIQARMFGEPLFNVRMLVGRVVVAAQIRCSALSCGVSRSI